MNQDRDNLIAQAMAATQAQVEANQPDPARPQFHFTAPAQWMNDPNGPLFHNGWYHMFYQFNPYGDQWGHMHWGHARSKDMVNWEHLPVALWPSKSNGEDHVYSGSCYLVHGKPAAFYTSISHQRPPEQWMATPDDDDLLHWTKSNQNPIATSDLQEWRDPFFFEFKGQTYMVVGGGENDRGIVALYKAANSELTRWEYQNILFHHPDEKVKNIECPNLAPLDGKWILLISVSGRVESYVGDLNDELQFVSERRDVLDPGSYASQLLTDESGQLVHFAWVVTNNHQGWNGFLTLPSALSISNDGQLLRKPINALAKLRTKELKAFEIPLEVDQPYTLDDSGDLLEIIAEIELKDSKEVELILSSESNTLTLTYGREASQKEKDHYWNLEGAEKLTIHLFIDRGVVEQYLQNGENTATIRTPFYGEGVTIEIKAIGSSICVNSLAIYNLARPLSTLLNSKETLGET